MKDDLDEAAISDLRIVDLPSTSKPSSKPKPKSVSDPPNDNDTDKEARKVTKIAHNEEKQRCCPDHSNKHDDEENNNDKNRYDNHDDNDENGHKLAGVSCMYPEKILVNGACNGKFTRARKGKSTRNLSNPNQKKSRKHPRVSAGTHACFRHRDFFWFGFETLRVAFPLRALLELRALQKYQIVGGTIGIAGIVKIPDSGWLGAGDENLFGIHTREIQPRVSAGTRYARLLQTRDFFWFGFETLRVDFPLRALLELRALQKYQIAGKSGEEKSGTRCAGLTLDSGRFSKTFEFEKSGYRFLQYWDV
eukprot:scaffold46534_cov37-Attheya_sp.AAC.1